MGKFACVLFENCAIWQVTLLQKFLKDNGWEMETLTHDGLPVSTDGGLDVHAASSFSAADSNKYRMILIPGGEITPSLAENRDLHNFLENFNGLIAASCASAVLLGASGLIVGNYTTMPHVKDLFSSYFAEGTYMDSDVYVNNKIITSKGYAHYEFMMAVLEKLKLTEQDTRLEKIALKLSRNV
ncbi:DJ-1/PfpI family protein [Sutcliffiella sp. NPDC057660]|uniref:DJ-1/PfpI family protein n=1 Tax=Sutcliffiella sp. NPDC057660 TaxID=3346199 RepID=UPI003690AE08